MAKTANGRPDDNTMFYVPGAKGSSSQILNVLKTKLARLKSQGYEWFTLEIKGEARKDAPPRGATRHGGSHSETRTADPFPKTRERPRRPSNR